MNITTSTVYLFVLYSIHMYGCDIYSDDRPSIINTYARDAHNTRHHTRQNTSTPSTHSYAREHTCVDNQFAGCAAAPGSRPHRGPRRSHEFRCDVHASIQYYYSIYIYAVLPSSLRRTMIMMTRRVDKGSASRRCMPSVSFSNNRGVRQASPNPLCQTLLIVRQMYGSRRIGHTGTPAKRTTPSASA